VHTKQENAPFIGLLNTEILSAVKGAERVFSRSYWGHVGGKFFNCTDWDKKSGIYQFGQHRNVRVCREA
jgi:hypothetical protein